ncbi:hypothetical protein Hte_012008 [Hypoxylon texense]
MRLVYIAAFLGASLAVPILEGTDNNSPQLLSRDADADDLVHNSWSARATIPRDAKADADDLVKNSWSARAVVSKKGEVDGHVLVLPREVEADADDLVHNSWSART